MTVLVRMKSGAAVSYSHVTNIEHVRGEYAVFLTFDGGPVLRTRLNDYDIEDMKVSAK